MSDPIATLARYVDQQAKAAGFCPLCNGQQTDGRTVAHARTCPVLTAPQHVEGIARDLVAAGDEFEELRKVAAGLRRVGERLRYSVDHAIDYSRYEQIVQDAERTFQIADKVLEAADPKNSKPPVG